MLFPFDYIRICHKTSYRLLCVICGSCPYILWASKCRFLCLVEFLRWRKQPHVYLGFWGEPGSTCFWLMHMMGNLLFYFRWRMTVKTLNSCELSWTTSEMWISSARDYVLVMPLVYLTPPPPQTPTHTQKSHIVVVCPDQLCSPSSVGWPMQMHVLTVSFYALFDL